MRKISQLELTKKKYIIFDMDGTLIDSIGVWNRIDQKLIEKYGNQLIGLEKIQIERDAFFHNNQDSDIYLAYCEYLIHKYQLTISDSKQLLKIRIDISNEVLTYEMDFKPDVVELILRFKQLGFILILATMTSQLQMGIYSHKNRKMIQQMNIEKTFDFVITKDDVKNKKPSPEIYIKIMEYYNAKPSECLVFEDSYTGVLASHNAGIEVVNVYDRYSDIDRDKIDEIVDYSIKSYREFLSLIDIIYPIESEKESRKILN